MKRKASQGNHFSLTITHKFHFLKKYWAYSDVILAQIFNFINCLKKDPTPVLVSWPHQQGTTRAGVSNVDIHFAPGWVTWHMACPSLQTSNLLHTFDKFEETWRILKNFKFEISISLNSNDFLFWSLLSLSRSRLRGPHTGKTLDCKSII